MYHHTANVLPINSLRRRLWPGPRFIVCGSMWRCRYSIKSLTTVSRHVWHEKNIYGSRPTKVGRYFWTDSFTSEPHNFANTGPFWLKTVPIASSLRALSIGTTMVENWYTHPCKSGIQNTTQTNFGTAVPISVGAQTSNLKIKMILKRNFRDMSCKIHKPLKVNDL